MVRPWHIWQGDCRDSLAFNIADKSVHCCVTSPPYFGLRDYGVDGQIGLEVSPDLYVQRVVDAFREVRRVLRDDGTLWLNLGDSYVASACGVKSGGVSGSSGLNGAGSKAYAATLEAGHGKTVDKTQFGLPAKNLIGIPWRVAFALQADGWYLRQDIIWHKPNPMPESVRDRCTKAHEYVFLLSKSERYYFDSEAMRERAVAADIGAMDGGSQRRADGTDANDGRNFRSKANSFKRDSSKRAEVIPGQTVGTHRAEREESTYDTFTRNKRSVWTIATRPYKGAHFATFPPALVEPCILAGSPVGGVVLDPFAGSGTTGAVAMTHGRNFIGCELNPEYIALAEARIAQALESRLW